MSAVRATRAAAVLVVAALALAACGTVTGDDAPVPTTPGASQRPGSPSATPASSTPVPSPPPPFDLVAQRRATAAYPPKDRMPSGWIQVDPTKELPQYPGDPVYCGVRLEAETAKGSALHLYRASDAGPYVLQYTFVLSDGVAEQVMGELSAAVTACIDQGRDAQGRVFPARQPPTVGAESVSMAFVADAGAVSQVTVFRRGQTLVALVGFTPAGLPPLEALGAIAGEVDAVLRAG